MIQITIKINKGKVLDSLITKNTTLGENALALRRLEEIKLKLLNIDYKSDIEVNKKWKIKNLLDLIVIRK